MMNISKAIRGKSVAGNKITMISLALVGDIKKYPDIMNKAYETGKRV